MADADALARVPRCRFVGEAYRHQAPGYDPRSGEGARRRGGRFNPRDSFAVLYLCRTRACSVAELRREGERQPIGLAGLLPRVLYRYHAALDNVLDLADPAVLEGLKLTEQDLVQSDWKMTQDFGTVCHHLGCTALLAPSATGVDSILVVFIENIGLGRVEPMEVEHWETVADL